MRRRRRVFAPESDVCIARQAVARGDGVHCRRCRDAVTGIGLRYIRLAATDASVTPMAAVNCWLCMVCTEDAHAHAESYAPAGSQEYHRRLCAKLEAMAGLL